MANLYGFKSRSGKQCRERWHNHLDPIINKDYWTEKEENILFMKHMEYGNKWSDIAKFLPGRTDNAIKNHFYSKLRKFIRKILKQINKDNLLKQNGIDPNKYNSDRVYKMIKKNKMAYNSLNKDSILTLIINFEKNNKNHKADHILGRKTQRKKGKVATSYNNNLNIKENLYDKAGRRIGIKYENEDDFEERIQPKIRFRKGSNLPALNSLYATNINTRRKKVKKEGYGKVVQTRSKRHVKRRMKDDFIYENQNLTESSDDNEDEDDEQYNENFNIENIPTDDNNNGKELVKRNLNIIINKSVLFKNYVKEEEEKRSSEKVTNKNEFNFGMNNNINTKNQNFQYNNANINIMNSLDNLPSLRPDSIPIMLGSSSSTTNPSVQPIPILNPLISMTPTSNYILDDRLFRYDNYHFMDSAMPLISPINMNPNTKLYPTSTRNYFNIDMHDTNYPLPMQIQGYNIFRPYSNANNNFITTPTGQVDKISYNQPYTPNKEVSMHNKILITNNEVEEVDRLDRTLTPSFKPLDTKNKESLSKEGEGQNLNVEQFEQLSENKKRCKRPSLDLNLVNTSETGKIFSASVGHTFMNNKNQVVSPCKDIIMEIQAPIESSLPKENRERNDCEMRHTLSTEREEEGSVTNISEKSGHKFSDNKTPKASDSMMSNLINNMNSNTTTNLNKSPILTPTRNLNAHLSVSPKSAFVKLIKK